MSLDTPFLPVCEKILKEWQKKESITEEEEEQDPEDSKASPLPERKIPESKTLLKKEDTPGDDEYSL